MPGVDIEAQPLGKVPCVNGVADDFQIILIDVRESHERAAASIGGKHIPLGQIHNYIDEISSDKKIIFYCRSGIRSANAIRLINSMKPFDNLYNLEGGIIAWALTIDPSLQVS